MNTQAVLTMVVLENWYIPGKGVEKLTLSACCVPARRCAGQLYIIFLKVEKINESPQSNTKNISGWHENRNGDILQINSNAKA